MFKVFRKIGKLFVWPPQTHPRPSLSPRPAGMDFRLCGGIHGYDYVYDLVLKGRNFVNVNLNVNGERVLEGMVLLRYDHQLVP